MEDIVLGIISSHHRLIPFFKRPLQSHLLNQSSIHVQAAEMLKNKKLLHFTFSLAFCIKVSSSVVRGLIWEASTYILFAFSRRPNFS
jgi:hypothetical protein